MDNEFLPLGADDEGDEILHAPDLALAGTAMTWLKDQPYPKLGGGGFCFSKTLEDSAGVIAFAALGVAIFVFFLLRSTNQYHSMGIL